MNARNLSQLDEEDFELCLKSKRFYKSDAFPKICNTCDKTYHTREQFVSETAALLKGAYSRGTKGKVFEYRNCKCGSTLVCVVESRRDESPQGLLRRQEFEKQILFLQANGIERQRAREIILAKYKKNN